MSRSVAALQHIRFHLDYAYWKDLDVKLSNTCIFVEIEQIITELETFKLSKNEN